MGSRHAAVLLTTGALVLSACAGGQTSACGAVETAFEASNIHVLPGSDVAYELSPPTSGPHMVPAPAPGVYTASIAEPLQVGALESGTVIVQYSESLAAADIAELEGLAQDQPVIVAPAARTLDDGAVVAFTAWGTRRLCSAVDVDAARSFIDGHSTAPAGQHE